MRELYLILLLLSAAFNTHAQGIINNGASIVLSNNAYIYIDGAANGSYLNLGNGEIESNGTLELEGDWINNSLTDIFQNINNQGTVVFSGSSNQEIGGSHTTVFENIEINNSTADVYISQDLTVSYDINMTSGDFDLKDNQVTLGTTGLLQNETDARRIKATDASNVDGNGLGTIITTRNNPSGNVGNLGLTVNLTGTNITILRGHLAQAGTGSFSGNSSVLRYFEVSPVANGGGGQSITFNDCFSSELNGHLANELILYQWMEENNSGIEYWHPIPDNNSGASVPITQTLDLATLNYIKVTLGSETMPLPIDLTTFKGSCNNGKISLIWETASEQNSSYYELYVSIDGFNYNYLSRKVAAGYSNNLIKYTYDYIEKENAEVYYYKLIQYDLNGNSYEYYTSIQNCNETENTILFLNNPANQFVKIRLNTINSHNFTLSFYNTIGQEMIKKKVKIDNESNTITVNTSNLSEGYYHVVLYNTNSVISKRLLIKR